MMEAGKRELAESWAGCPCCILVHTGHTECEVTRWGNMLQSTSALAGVFLTSRRPSSTRNVHVQSVFQFPVVFSSLLGLCKCCFLCHIEASVPLQGRQGSRGCIPDTPGETDIHLQILDSLKVNLVRNKTNDVRSSQRFRNQ